MRSGCYSLQALAPTRFADTAGLVFYVVKAPLIRHNDVEMFEIKFDRLFL